MLLKYGCGCIGFKFAEKDYVLKACDSGRDSMDWEFGCWPRTHMDKKPTVPLDPVEGEALLKQIGTLLIDGHHARIAARIFKHLAER